MSVSKNFNHFALLGEISAVPLPARVDAIFAGIAIWPEKEKDLLLADVEHSFVQMLYLRQPNHSQEKLIESRIRVMERTCPADKAIFDFICATDIFRKRSLAVAAIAENIHKLKKEKTHPAVKLLLSAMGKVSEEEKESPLGWLKVKLSFSRDLAARPLPQAFRRPVLDL
jgi:hypothetical protein